MLDGKFLVEDLFNSTEQLRKDLLTHGMPTDLMNDLLNGSVNLTEFYQNFNGSIDIEPFCRKDFLNHLITIDNSTQTDVLVQALCHLNMRKLLANMNFFTNEMDIDTINNYVMCLSLCRDRTAIVPFFSLPVR